MKTRLPSQAARHRNVDRKETRAKTKDLAFVYPLEGVPQDTALLNILMECWPPARISSGSERVMEYWKKENNPAPIL